MPGRSTAITLTTDFGLADPFVGVMKGVILGIAPEATLVDVTHDVPPQAVADAAYHLSNAWRHFPRGTVHLAVVDPGVGTSRRALALYAAGHLFVAPDNGLLTPFLDEADSRAFEITASHYLAASPAPTFHGRDIFAPAAAHLARGTPIENLGGRIADPLRLETETARIEGSSIQARVLHVDRFGNIVLNLDGAHLAQAFAGRPAVQLRARIAGEAVETFVTHYAAADGRLCFLLNSDGRLEIALPGGSAAAKLSLARGARVVIEVA